MSSERNKRKYRDEICVYGYCRQILIDITDIPDVILKLILKWYHIKLQDIKFNIYHKNNFKMFNNYKEFKVKIFNEYDSFQNRMLSTNIGYNKGYHEWKIKCINHSGSFQAIGGHNDYKQIVNYESAWFGSGKTITYHWYGYDQCKIYSDTESECKEVEKIEEGWISGDILTVILDCNNWTMYFRKNDKRICKTFDIQPNITYYPAIAICGAKEHYMVITE